MIAPNSNIYLLKCPLEIDNNHQINFPNATSQFNYFNSLPKTGGGDYTYQRENDVIRFPALIDEIKQYNYVMYQNESHGSKWFYAFITDMKYMNDNMTLVSIKTDSFQTWQFDIHYKKSFVVREHVSDDTIGLHTIPENLETGEYIVNNQNNLHSLTETAIIVASTVKLTGEEFTDSSAGIYNNLMTGFKYYFYHNNFDGVNHLANAIDNLKDRKDAIINIFMCPLQFFDTLDYDDGDAVQFSYSEKSFLWDTIPGTINRPITKPRSLDGYIPKNNKMFTNPYCYLYITNNAGNNAQYFFEDFTGGNICQFKINGCISIGASGICYPLNYKKCVNNYSEGLPLPKLPTCGWQSDAYTNWLTQNAVNIPVGIAEEGLNIGNSIAGANLIMASKSAAAQTLGKTSIATSLISGGLNIASQLYNVYTHSKEPPQAYGLSSCGDVNYSSKIATMTAYTMTIKNEYAKIIDDFFSFYGYKVNYFKVPNLNNRENWNYVETESINIEGNIPQSDIENIKQMFDTGVTLWHKPSNFLNYNVRNNIV